jgi:hypothetical protein
LLTKGSADEDVNMLADEFDVAQPFCVDVPTESYNWKAEVCPICCLVYQQTVHALHSLAAPNHTDSFASVAYDADFANFNGHHTFAPSASRRISCCMCQCSGCPIIYASSTRHLVRSMRSFVINGPYIEPQSFREFNHTFSQARMLTTLQLHPLTALMSLLSCLTMSLSSFCPFLLSERPANGPAEQSTPLLLELLHEIVRDHLIPPKPPDEDYAPDIQALCKETMNLLDALCWMSPDEHAEKYFFFATESACLILNDHPRLSCIPLDHEMLSIMLDASQPTWMVARSARILVILATRAYAMVIRPSISQR